MGLVATAQGFGSVKETLIDSSPLGHAVSGGPAGDAMRARIAAGLFGQGGQPVVIGRFEVAEQIGVGGMGSVLRAFDPQLVRDVAVKIVHRDRVSEQERDRTIREAQALAKLNHPNVVVVYEAGEYDGRVFIAMEYVAGRTLAKWQASEHPSPAAVLEVYLQAGEGLAAAHSAGIIHRDFKPANVLIGDDGRVRVADFGLARGAGSSTLALPRDEAEPNRLSSSLGSDQLTKTGTVLGTPAYMAPEQLVGLPADARSDQFSFCVALWEALTDQRPYTPEQLRRALVQPEAKPGIRAGRLDRRLRKIISRGLAISPGDRWPSVPVLLEELRRSTNNGRSVQVAFVIGGVAALSLAWLASSTDRRPSACEQLPDDVTQKWSAARKTAIRARLGSATVFGADLWANVEPRLDDHYETWSRAYAAVCHRNSPANSAAVGCLQRTALRSASVLAVLERGAPAALARVHVAANSLESPEACLDPDRLAVRPEPTGASTFVTAVHELRAEIDRAQLDLDLGQPIEAHRQAQESVRRASELAHAPTLAEAHWLMGRTARAIGDTDVAAREFDAALFEAQRSRHDDVVAGALISSSRLDAVEREELSAAMHSLQLAEATIDRGATEAVRWRELDEARLEILRAQGDLEQATNLARQLRRRPDAQAGSDNSRSWAARQLANILASRGHTQAAEALYLELLSERAQVLGSKHPDLAKLLLGLGLLDAEQPDKAIVHLQRAVDILADTFPADSVKHARYLTALALAKVRAGQLPEGRSLAERAWELQRSLPSQHSERGGALALLVEFDLAEGNDELLIEHLQQLPEQWDDNAHRDRLAEATNRLAWHLCRLRRCAEAGPHYRRLRQLTKPGERLRRFADLGLARVDVATGRTAQAIPVLERIWRSASDDERASDYALEAGYALGLALLGTDSGDGRGRRLLLEVRTRWSDREDYAWAREEIDAALREGRSR